MKRRASCEPSSGVVYSLALAVAACGPPPPSPDDAASPDATTARSDASTPDTAPAPDAPTPPPPGACSLRRFPPTHFFYRDVSAMSPAPESAAIIAQLERDGGWGNTNRFQVDFSFYVLEADAATFRRRADTIAYEPATDSVELPFPAGGRLEGHDGYVNCEGDCHLIVHRCDEPTLIEAHAVRLAGPPTGMAQLGVDSIARWDLTRDLGPTGRGLGCTSADAAGFPIAPGLIRMQEILDDRIEHALRFALPNPRMRRNAFVAPATHYGAPSNDSVNAIPYGTRLRLRASFDESRLPSAGARAIARALKRYGMLLADGGQIALMAENDGLATRRWAFNGGDVPLGPQDVRAMTPADFEVVDFGPVQVGPRPDCMLRR